MLTLSAKLNLHLCQIGEFCTWLEKLCSLLIPWLCRNPTLFPLTQMSNGLQFPWIASVVAQFDCIQTDLLSKLTEAAMTAKKLKKPFKAKVFNNDVCENYSTQTIDENKQ